MEIRPFISPEPDPISTERPIDGPAERAPGEDFYAFAGRVSLGNKLWDSTSDPDAPNNHAYGTPENPYDPLASFAKKHRTTQAEIITEGQRKRAEVERERIASPEPRATNSLQEAAAMRANARIDAINKRQQIQRRHIELYGPILWDKDAVDDAIKRGQYTRGEKGAIRKASKNVRRSQNSINRITRRLDKSVAGNDVPGRMGRTRIRVTRRIRSALHR